MKISVKVVADSLSEEGTICAAIYVKGGMRKRSEFFVTCIGYGVKQYVISGPLYGIKAPRPYVMKESIAWIKSMVKERSSYYE